MSHRPDDIKCLEKRNEANEELQKDASGAGIENTAGEEKKDDRLAECEQRLENLKEEIKTLKKLKKRQDKINKLEDERIEVIREIERRKYDAERSRRHDRH
jgi:predicted RNase H-like nuclease (RuvC/YqgF family)